MPRARRHSSHCSSIVRFDLMLYLVPIHTQLFQDITDWIDVILHKIVYVEIHTITSQTFLDDFLRIRIIVDLFLQIRTSGFVGKVERFIGTAKNGTQVIFSERWSIDIEVDRRLIISDLFATNSLRAWVWADVIELLWLTVCWVCEPPSIALCLPLPWCPFPLLLPLLAQPVFWIHQTNKRSPIISWCDCFRLLAWLCSCVVLIRVQTMEWSRRVSMGTLR